MILTGQPQDITTVFLCLVSKPCGRALWALSLVKPLVGDKINSGALISWGNAGVSVWAAMAQPPALGIIWTKLIVGLMMEVVWNVVLPVEPRARLHRCCHTSPVKQDGCGGSVLPLQNIWSLLAATKQRLETLWGWRQRVEKVEVGVRVVHDSVASELADCVELVVSSWTVSLLYYWFYLSFFQLLLLVVTVNLKR